MLKSAQFNHENIKKNYLVRFEEMDQFKNLSTSADSDLHTCSNYTSIYSLLILIHFHTSVTIFFPFFLSFLIGLQTIKKVPS